MMQVRGHLAVGGDLKLLLPLHPPLTSLLLNCSVSIPAHTRSCCPCAAQPETAAAGQRRRQALLHMSSSDS